MPRRRGHLLAAQPAGAPPRAAGQADVLRLQRLAAGAQEVGQLCPVNDHVIKRVPGSRSEEGRTYPGTGCPRLTASLSAVCSGAGVVGGLTQVDVLDQLAGGLLGRARLSRTARPRASRCASKPASMSAAGSAAAAAAICAAALAHRVRLGPLAGQVEPQPAGQPADRGALDQQGAERDDQGDRLDRVAAGERLARVGVLRDRRGRGQGEDAAHAGPADQQRSPSGGSAVQRLAAATAAAAGAGSLRSAPVATGSRSASGA